jgi:hypothetical protein
MVPMRRVEHLARRSSRQDFNCAKARSPGALSPGVVVVELLVVRGLFAVILVPGALHEAGPSGSCALSVMSCHSDLGSEAAQARRR